MEYVIGHTFASKLYSDEEIADFDIQVNLVSSADLCIEISIPRYTSSNEIRTDNPDYNKEGMEYLLQAIWADENITLQNIGLRDTEMSAKGSVISSRKKEEFGELKFRYEFTDQSSWDSAPSGPDRIHLKVSRNDLSDILVPQIDDNHSEIEPEEFNVSNEIVNAMKNGENISDLMDSYSMLFRPFLGSE